jgi:hypothetical protein
MLETILACLIALVGLVTIAGGAWGIFKVLGDVRAIRRASHG